mgnify:CR=1 FL=1
MRRTLAAIVSASALAAAAGWAEPVLGAQPAGAPGRPAATGPGVAAPPPVPPEKSARDATTPPPTARWNKTHPGLEAADTRECLGCHGEQMVTHSHPVEVDYAEKTSRGGFRPIDEVRARGVVLRDGKVGCPTCHSAASPWARFLAVPRELARARPGMAELKAEAPEGVPEKAIAAPPADGAEVSSRPLCESCHLK